MDRSLRARIAQALRDVVEDNGRRVARRPELVRAMLSDALGPDARDARAEVEALSLAASQGVAGELIDGSWPDPERLTSLGLSHEMAAFAVDTWARALRREGPVSSGAAGQDEEQTRPAGAAPVPIDPGRTRQTPWPGARRGTAAGAGGTGAAAGASAGTSPSSTGRRPTRAGADNSTKFIVAAVLITAILVSLLWFQFGTGADSAAHDMTHSTGDSDKPQAPMNMPPKTPVNITSLAEPIGRTGDFEQAEPDGAGGGEAPVLADTPPPNPELTATDSGKAFTPLLSGSAVQGCVENAGSENLRFCTVKLDVAVGGNVENFDIVNVHAVEQHGKTEVVGRQIHYTPHHNGPFSDHLTYQVQGNGIISPVATITLDATCNTTYQCYHAR